MRSRLHKTKRTALHLAARYGKVKCIAELIKHGADLEAKDKDGTTPMALAVWRHHCEVIKALVKMGASKETTSKQDSKSIAECLKRKVSIKQGM